MAIIYNKTEEKTELQQKVLADLRAKQAASASDSDTAHLGTDYDNRAGATDEIKTIRLWLVVAVMLITAVLVVVVNQK